MSVRSFTTTADEPVERAPGQHDHIVLSEVVLRPGDTAVTRPHRTTAAPR